MLGEQAALEENAGIPDIEVVDPAVPGFAQRAAFLLNRDGVRSAKLFEKSSPARCPLTPAAAAHSTASSRMFWTRSASPRSVAAARSPCVKWSAAIPIALSVHFSQFFSHYHFSFSLSFLSHFSHIFATGQPRLPPLQFRGVDRLLRAAGVIFFTFWLVCSSRWLFTLQDYWSVLLDPPAVMEIMEAIFGTKDFVNNSGAGGGDFNTPGSTECVPGEDISIQI